MLYVRVKDKDTGHEFDVPESDKRIGKSFTPISKKHYPPSRVPRRPKYHIGSAPAPVTNKPPVEADESQEEKNNG